MSRPRFTLSRRRVLEVGAATAFGLNWPNLLRAREEQTAKPPRRQFGRAQSCVVIFLWGGLGQQDLWDPKPLVPAEIRSEFAPIATNVPGIEITEPLPQLARQTDKFTIIRSMTHRDFEHGTAAYTALTGQPHPQPGTNTPASPDDFPRYGAVVSAVGTNRRPVPDAVVLGPVLHQGNRPPVAGQNGGFLGAGYDLFRIADDPNAENFRVDGIALPEAMNAERFRGRFGLLSQFEANAGLGEADLRIQGMSDLYQRARGLLGSAETQQAFELDAEPAQRRERYGRTRFGQTLLLARRLVEARVPLIQVNWSRQNADQWDTHKKSYPTLRKLLPSFDQALAAFLEDLHERGLLESTLVVCLGEFGRTPKVNPDGGRDHWPDCYSVVIAGGGIAGGRVYGASNKDASYPSSQHVAPWDLAAMLYHQLGIDPHGHLTNRQGQPLMISRGQSIAGLI